MTAMTTTQEKPKSGEPEIREGGGTLKIDPKNPCDDELVELLAAEPAVCFALKEALASGRWLLTISRKVKDAPPGDLESKEIHRDFPLVDAPDALQGICKAILEHAGAQIEQTKRRVLDSRNWR